MNKIIITGRTQAGKTRFAKLLAEKTGLTLLKTCTNRPRRTPDEDGYHFYSKQEAAAIPDDDKLLLTVALDGHERWTSMKDLMDADIAILDILGTAQATWLYQAHGCNVIVIYIMTDYDNRHETFIQDMTKAGKSWKDAAHDFCERNKTETAMFDAVETKFRLPSEQNCIISLINAPLDPDVKPADDPRFFGEDWMYIYRNNFTPKNMADAVDIIMSELDKYKNAQSDGYREFHDDEPLILEPEDWTRDEWKTICKMTGLVPDLTTRIQLDIPAVKCFIDNDADNEYADD